MADAAPPRTTPPPVSPALNEPAFAVDIAAEAVPHSDSEDDDIYRGELPPPQLRLPSPESIRSTSSSSSSSSFFGGRLGAIASVVEQAIHRWARANDSESSLSSSSSSSSNSASTLSQGQNRRRNRAQARRLRSERDVAEILDARQAAAQHVAREFVLYVPLSLAAGKLRPQRGVSANPSGRVFKTQSLSELLETLDGVLKKSVKLRRQYFREMDPVNDLAPKNVDVSSLHHDYMIPEEADRTTSKRRTARKVKERETFLDSKIHPSLLKAENATLKGQKAWWLDVSSPTWDDMRALGQLLHLHPLTLEDILHQDPREKLEIFPRLGYYFVVFRAIGSRSTQERIVRNDARHADASGPQVDGGVIGEVKIYLVVFREGIATFHFADIMEHTDRVRNRVLLLEQIVNMSPDWIAHGILDSIVDSFVPFLKDIEREVVEIENRVFTPGRRDEAETQDLPMSCAAANLDGIEGVIVVGGDVSPLSKDVDDAAEGNLRARALASFVGRLPLPRKTTQVSLVSRSIGRAWTAVAAAMNVHISPPASGTLHHLRRMARARRLVTSLTRLLATKSEVVTQIRKRLLTSGSAALGNASDSAEDAEVAIHLSDVQDHILTLQSSLAHYERMLSQSHPNYLASLSNSVAMSKQGSDKAIMMLTVLSVSVLSCQTVIGFFSMNVTIPTNLVIVDGSPTAVNNVFTWFPIVIGLCVLALCSLGLTIRLWWIMASRRHRKVLQ